MRSLSFDSNESESVKKGWLKDKICSVWQKLLVNSPFYTATSTCMYKAQKEYFDTQSIIPPYLLYTPPPLRLADRSRLTWLEIILK